MANFKNVQLCFTETSCVSTEALACGDSGFSEFAASTSTDDNPRPGPSLPASVSHNHHEERLFIFSVYMFSINYYKTHYARLIFFTIPNFIIFLNLIKNV